MAASRHFDDLFKRYGAKTLSHAISMSLTEYYEVELPFARRPTHAPAPSHRPAPGREYARVVLGLAVILAVLLEPLGRLPSRPLPRYALRARSPARQCLAPPRLQTSAPLTGLAALRTEDANMLGFPIIHIETCIRGRGFEAQESRWGGGWIESAGNAQEDHPAVRWFVATDAGLHTRFAEDVVDLSALGRGDLGPPPSSRLNAPVTLSHSFSAAGVVQFSLSKPAEGDKAPATVLRVGLTSLRLWRSLPNSDWSDSECEQTAGACVQSPNLLYSFVLPPVRQLAEQYGPDAAAHMLSASNLGSGANGPYERSPLRSAANSNVELATMPYAGRGDGGGTHVKYDSVGAGGRGIQVSERWNASAGVGVGVDGDRWCGDMAGGWTR
ncbi:hypothetical protein DFH08DRAFT_824760 [Mycena albidolilacea]|uniref:Uncharacterized protein n=1 Tax=Mycena albidolilacea TaxID=1033008 RepID=A0AAD7EAL8_9AGAR|nr:hypothetical protein DFH08DRAFT_824760 [Mycena albidolilacea]